MPSIRAYTTQDKPHIIDLFLHNTPAFFHPGEQQDLDLYLDTEIEGYFVAEENGLVIACGGYNIEDNAGWLSWYIVHPSWHGKGVGRMIVERSLTVIRSTPGIHKLIVRTSQLVWPFYEKFGFKLLSTEDNYWGEGMHLYHMEQFV